MNIGQTTAKAVESAAKITEALRETHQSSRAILEPIMRRILTEGKTASRAIPGRIYTFKYDAKHKQTLPYWDAHPVILVIGLAEQGFIGLNFHYLPFDYRIQCLHTLDSATAPTDLKLLQFRWEVIKKSAIKHLGPQMVKRYLRPYMKSSLIEVHPKDWYLVMALPLAKFVKATEDAVGLISIRNSRDKL